MEEGRLVCNTLHKKTSIWYLPQFAVKKYIISCNNLVVGISLNHFAESIHQKAVAVVSCRNGKRVSAHFGLKVMLKSGALGPVATFGHTVRLVAADT